MPGTVIEKLKLSIQAAEGLCNRLVLLVGGVGSGKTATLRELAAGYEVPVVNVNLQVSRELLPLTPRQRPLRVSEILEDLVSQARPPVVLDNLEILFDAALRQNPLALLRLLSRNQVVVAAWSGRVDSGKLCYAQPGHAEHRSYDLSSDLLIVDMDGAATVG